jgi:hypothetical protein
MRSSPATDVLEMGQRGIAERKYRFAFEENANA